MAETVSQKVLQFIQDADTVENVVNGAPNTQIKSRLGRYIWTLATIGYKIEIVNQQANAAIAKISQDKTSVSNSATTALIGIQSASDSVKDSLDAKIDALSSAINTAAAAGAGANGWVSTLVKDATDETQQQINDASIYTVGSVAKMLALDERYKQRTVRIKATGAMYVYDATKATQNNGFTVLNGWLLVGYYDKLLCRLIGLKGDGSDEYNLFKVITDIASISKLPVDLCGLTITTSPLTATGDLKFIGTGGIKLANNKNTALLMSDYNLVIDGDITIDYNKDNNGGGTITNESHCSINHNGDNLILRGAKFKPSTSINVVTYAKKQLICNDVEMEGGLVTLYALPSPSACVKITGGEYKNASRFDNIQVLQGEDIHITGVTSHSANRSGIVVGNKSKKARVIGNLCHSNKIDIDNEGGWGIVCSINTQNSSVSSNICIGNQRGGISIDVYPENGDSSVDNRVNVFGNVIDGEYNGGYSTTGIVLNNATHAIVAGNNIHKVSQGILCVEAKAANVYGNTIQDVEGFFVNFVKSDNAVFKENICDGAIVSGNACLRAYDSNGFEITGNTVTNLTGVGNIVFDVHGNSKDWLIKDNNISKLTTGNGYLFNIWGADNTGGVIKNNEIKSNVLGWQWIVLSDDAASFKFFDNEIDVPNISVFYKCSNMTAGDNTINGSRNMYVEIPTGFKSRTGQVANIAGALKTWNGSAWI